MRSAVLLVLILASLIFRAKAADAPQTVDDVVQAYLQAVGVDKLASVSTLIMRGRVTGDIMPALKQFNAPHPQKQVAIIESYDKRPNLGMAMIKSEEGIPMHGWGCDGVEQWFAIGSQVRHEKASREDHGCDDVLQPLPAIWAGRHAKLRLAGTKKVGGRTAWAVKVSYPGNEHESTYLFDSETHLLLHSTSYLVSPWWPGAWPVMKLETNYSDYHDVAGVKWPFRVDQRTDNTERSIVWQRVTVNQPVDDTAFERPRGSEK